MFGLVDEGKKYTNYQMNIYSKWKCNPLQCIAGRYAEDEEVNTKNTHHYYSGN